MRFIEFWNSLLNSVAYVAPSLILVVSVAGILGIMLFCIIKIKSKYTGVFISVFVSCFLMIFVVSSVKNIAKVRILTASTEELERIKSEAEFKRNQRQILEMEREIRRNEIAMELQALKIDSLDESIKLLERTQLSISNFQEIFEFALLQTNISRTTFNQEKIGEEYTGWGFKADNYYDELLVVLSYDIDAKFGIDLNLLKISKVDDDSIIISGIAPKFIGSIGNRHDRHVAEIRRVNQKDNYGERTIDTVNINNNREASAFSEDRAWEFTRQFHKNLENGSELGFMDSAVIQLSQNFLRYIFSPFYTNIEFSNIEIQGAVPFMEYFQTEANTLIEQRDRLSKNQGEV